MKLKANPYDLESWSVLLREAQVSEGEGKGTTKAYRDPYKVVFLYVAVPDRNQKIAPM